MGSILPRKRAAGLGAVLAAVLFLTTGCGEYLIGANISPAPVTFGLQVGTKAPITHSWYIGEKMKVVNTVQPGHWHQVAASTVNLAAGRSIRLKWFDVTTLQVDPPGWQFMQNHSVAYYQRRHLPVLVVFDVPVHETLGFKDVEYLTIIHQEFPKMPIVYIDTWMDLPVVPLWNMTTASHHGYFIVGPHDTIRYSWVGLFSIGSIQTDLRLFYQHNYQQLWNLSPSTNRLPWNQQPGVSGKGGKTSA